MIYFLLHIFTKKKRVSASDNVNVQRRISQVYVFSYCVVYIHRYLAKGIAHLRAIGAENAISYVRIVWIHVSYVRNKHTI